MTILTCPTCGRTFDSQKSQAMPFCCDRCRDVDLGRWLTEHHSLPLDPEDEGEFRPRDERSGREDDRD